MDALDVQELKRKREDFQKSYLVKVQKIDWKNLVTSKYFSLPIDPSVTAHPRFKAEGKEEIPIIHRKLTKKLYETILSCVKEVPHALYVQGPIGVGKSHSLAQIVTWLRSDPNNRVIYIANCQSWATLREERASMYLLTAIVLAFEKDDEIIKQIEALQPPDILDKSIDLLPEYCKKYKLQLFVIFDQHNGISQELRTKFPWSLPEQLSSRFLGKNFPNLTVVSASANNEYYLKVAAKGNWPQFFFYEGFNDIEFDEWVKQNKFFPNDTDLIKVKKLTSCLPFELAIFLDLRKNNTSLDLASLIDKYVFQRENDMNGQQKIWRKTLTPEDLRSARETVVAMILQIPCSPPCLNFQLMYQDDKGIPKAITQLARQVLVKYWGTSIDDEFYEAVKRVFSLSHFSASVKGYTVQQYILHEILKTHILSLDLLKIDFSKKDPSTWIKTTIEAKNLAIYQFDGDIPQKDPIQWLQSCLFTPTDINYPYVDFFFWDQPNHIFYAFQITVANPISSHDSSASNFLKKPFPGQKQMRTNAWNYRADNQIKEFRFVWIGGNSSVSSNMDGQYYCALQSLNLTLWPLIKCLNL